MTPSTQIMKALREIATNLQVHDQKRAHAQMEIVAIFAGVDASTVYAVSEEMAKEATERGHSARAMSWDSTTLVGRLNRLDQVIASISRPGDMAAIYAEENGVDYASALVACNMD